VGEIGSIVLIIIFIIIAIRVKEEKPTQRIIQYIKCQKCNSEITVGNNFCTKCGEKI
jgi:hypothetical protein